jgi:hypothetical protein
MLSYRPHGGVPAAVTKQDQADADGDPDAATVRTMMARITPEWTGVGSLRPVSPERHELMLAALSDLDRHEYGNGMA